MSSTKQSNRSSRRSDGSTSLHWGPRPPHGDWSQKSASELVELLKRSGQRAAIQIEEELTSRGSEGSRAVTSALLEAAAKHRRAPRIDPSKLILLAFMLVFSSIVGLIAAFSIGTSWSTKQTFLIGTSVPVAMFGGAWLAIRASIPRSGLDWRSRCLAVLEHRRNADAVAGIALFLDEPEKRNDAMSYLAPLLPIVDTGAYRAMDPRSKASLIRSIRYPGVVRNTEYLFRLIDLYCRVADPEAIPAIEALCAELSRSPTQAEQTGSGRDVTSGPTTHLLGALQAAISKITVRLAEIEQNGKLLRPAAEPAETLLLRTASEVAAEPEQLLRPTDN